MNHKRRKALREIADKINALKADLEYLRDEEQDAYDNMPENRQGGEKGEKAQSAIDSIDNAINELDSAVDSANEAAEN